MDENRARQRQRFQAVKWVVSKQDPALISDVEVAQTVPAWTVSRSNLDVSGVAVAGRAQRGSNQVCDLGWDGDNAKRHRDFSLGCASTAARFAVATRVGLSEACG